MAGRLTATEVLTNDASVLTPLHQPRAFVAALLLVVQVLGLGHVALARHTVSETGAIIDVTPLATETHDGDEDHLCAGDVELHADAPADCTVVASWSAASLLAPPLSLRHTPGASVGGITSLPLVAAQLDALSRAPKASPPQV